MLTEIPGQHSRGGIVPTLLGASLISVMVAVAVVQAWTMHIVAEAAENEVAARLDVDLGVLRAELMRLGTDWRLDSGGRLTVDGKPAEGLDEVVAEVGRLTHAVATVFAGDTRIATTVRRADGTLATGTRLAAGPAHDAIFGRRAAYRGEASILGARYLSVYEPVASRDGQLSAILFVGVPDADVQATRARLVRQSALTALMVAFGVGVILWTIMRAALRPLSSLGAAVNRIGDGDLGVTVPCAERRDQLGEIGRAVETLRLKGLHAKAVERQAALAREAAVSRQAALETLTQDFGTTMAGVLTHLIGSGAQMHHAATEMADAAGRSASDLVSRAEEIEQSSRNLSRVAASAEQLTASVGEVSSHVGRVAEAARDAVARAAATDATVRVLGSAANEIARS